MARPTTKKSTRRTRATQKASGTKPRLVKSSPSRAKAERPVRSKLPNVIRLTRKTYELLAINWKLLLGIAVVYGVLNILLVRGFNGGLDVRELKTELSQLFHGGWGTVASSFTVVALLVSSSDSTSTSDQAGAYQTLLVIIVSLALVWTFRQLLANRTAKLRIRDGFYQGMYPLVPVLLVLLVIGLQLIPMLIGGLLYSTVITNGIAVGAAEVTGWFVLFMLTIVISLLLITPSIIALYIVSLPNMTPKKALQSARELVRFRRWKVLGKILFLPVLMFLAICVLMLPIIVAAPVIAQWAFFVLSVTFLPIIHGYLYTLYRELLNE
jgi:hypothetical protein